MFRSFEDGARSVDDFVRIGKKYGLKDNIFRKMPDGSGRVTAIFSPARKGNYQWGGFRGQIVFDPKTNKITIIASDKFDLGASATGLITRRGMVNKDIINIMAPAEKDIPILKAKAIVKKAKKKKAPKAQKPLGKKEYKEEIIPKNIAGRVLPEPTKAEILASFRKNKRIFSNVDADNLGHLVRWTDDIAMTREEMARFLKSRAAHIGAIGGAGLLGMAAND
jgi:hypothetical protein